MISQIFASPVEERFYEVYRYSAQDQQIMEVLLYMTDYDPHRWLDHFLDIKGSMVRQISGRVALCVVWSAGVVWFHKAVAPVAMPSTLHSLVGVALGLLLVFRTNTSYDRFWEGRKFWGSIVNETRNLGRAARVVLSEAPDLYHDLVTWTSAFPYAVMSHLRGARPGQLLPPALARLPEAGHQPLAIAARMSGVLGEARRRGVISDYVQMQLDQNVQLLVDYCGGCERIHSTPLPFAYMVHLRRALVLYCFTLPFALVDSFGWATVLDTLMLAYTFFGIEEIGVQIEDPFGFDDNDLPLERYCATIERNLRELAAGSPAVVMPPPSAP